MTNVCILWLSCNVKIPKTTALCISEKDRDNFNEFMRKSFFCVCNDTGK